ncbi:carboxypeptidase regulatory-like domain-containing protein [Aurantiacibacter sp. MUD11]|uniref:TonB-dependent receptor n=1 Tax=Aurantiacibacter sp. MUD11 TaxID=3003265 RepID=UPI0022AA9C44|nr:carboxypeptidase regulatory-like domain-containing protein [Aurantiacibacter sp. MUD11]WAT17727.1 carboxypeptidase regulatory-like domain-containing protein [Aurantiacibacter sp. MUD11]
MKLRYLLAASVASVATAVAAPQAAYAQQITSGVQGTVTDVDGNALPGATVTVTDTRTNTVRTQTTDNSGAFRFGSLNSGGPYTVTVTASGFEGQSVEDQYINISGNTAYTFELTADAGAAADNFIIVTAARANVQQLAVGPGIALGQDTLEGFPSITRDVRDIIRIDPRVSLDRANEVDRISCLGGNDRSNTFTVDGIVQADVFGLNGTPFAARNSLPIPFDAIGETSVEFAPFDVEYSEFTGCLVNVVTKSGQNEFHGSAFYAFRNADLRGDSIDGTPNIVDDFKEKRWGATLSGPIIPDRLFFSAAYEETDLGSANDFGPAGSGFANEANFVTQQQFDRFAQIAQSVYGQDIGGYPTTLPESSVRYFGRLDAVVADGHRIEATYQRLEETNVESDTGSQELTGFNSFEDEGTVSDYYSLRMFNEWSDSVSTELRLSRADVADVQGPVGFGEAQSDAPTVRLAVGVVGPTQNGILATGPGIFRSANALNSQIDQAKFQVNISQENHDIKLGMELNDLEVYNLFAINATGTIFFRNLDDFENGVVASGGFSSVFGSADDLASGALGGATIAQTPSGDINETAATFNRRIFSLYAQDTWQANDNLSLTGGLRVQWYSGDAPRENPNFANRYGFSNAVAFSDLEPLVLPRFAFDYEFDNDGFFYDTRFTGGVGRFSGGDPVVYFSNAFSNNGFSYANGDTFSSECAGLLDSNGNFNVLSGGTFTGIPQCALDDARATAAAGLADTQSTDPNFTLPSVWRGNLGLASRFGTQGGFFSDWYVQLDYIYSRFVDTLNFVDLSQTPDLSEGIGGYTVDGRPIYAAIDPSNAGCGAILQGTGGTPPVYTNVSAACFNTRRDDEIQLTNGPNYDSHVISLLLNKQFEGGLFTSTGSVNVNMGYAWTESNNNRNNGSSTATSSYDVTAAFDRQDPAISTSNYETRHNFTLAVNLREQFIQDYDTQLGFIFVARSGRPYSLTFDGGGVFNDSSSGSDNALLYIPTGPNDPNLSPLSDMDDVNDLLNYLNTSEVGGQCDFETGASIARNTCRNDWFFDLDLRFSQEIPGPAHFAGVADDRLELFVDFDNFLNFFDDSWNVFRARGDFVDLVDGGVDSEGRYIISGFRPDDQNFVGTTSSIWRIQIGARYEF